MQVCKGSNKKRIGSMTEERDMDDAIYNMMVSDAAFELRLSGERVRQLAESGVLPCIRTRAGYRLFRRSDVLKVARERAARKGARREAAA